MNATVFLILRIILALSLYAFLAWAMITLWHDLKRHSQAAAARQPAALTLHPQTETEPACYQKLNVTIGRDPACDLFIDDLTVSVQHARFVFRQNQWWLEDLGSTNGTFLNDEKVDVSLVVTSGDQVRIGQVVIDVNIG